MKRVLLIVLNAEGTVGGEQRHVLQILDGLDRTEYEPTVVTWDIPAFVEELRARKVPAVVVQGTRILDWPLVKRIESIIVEHDVDLVHAHGHRAGLLGRVAALRNGRPRIVWTCHLAENKADRSPLLAWGYRAVLGYLNRRTDATVAVSTHLREWLSGEGIDPADVMVVPNGVDCSLFRPLPRDGSLAEQLGVDAGSPVLVCVARLTPQKGVESLVRASARLAERGVYHQVLVVGAGPLECELKSLAHELDAPVVFAGERSGIPSILSLADAVVVPSLWEGAFCYTVLEAMASERPLVCSDITIFSDVVAGRDVAVTFRADDPESLAEAIRSVLSDDDASTAMARRARRLVAAEYSVEAMQSTTRGLYERLLRKEAS